MLRHTAFFLFRDGVTPEQHLTMLKGLAYMRFECATVQHLDFGTDLFGGSREMYSIKPYRRTPRWRSRQEGPPTNYDVALHLDFVDAAGNDAYNDDAVHHEVADYNASISDGELTARIDWHYDIELPGRGSDEAPPGAARDANFLTRRGHVRHSEMFVWDDGVSDAAQQAALDAVQQLASAPGVESLVVGRNVGTLTTDYDWIVDIQVPDEQACKQLLGSDRYVEVMREVAPVTKYEWTARISHLMRGL
jgi:hypothetical protein